MVDFKEPVFSKCDRAVAYTAHSDCGGTRKMSTGSSQAKYGINLKFLFEEYVYTHFVGIYIYICLYCVDMYVCVCVCVHR